MTRLKPRSGAHVKGVSRSNRGKRFRDELQLTLRMLRVFRHCFDNTGHVRGPRRPADLIGTWRGFSVLLEAKETRKDTIDFSRVETHQEKHLRRQALDSQGLAYVAVRWCLPRRPRAFLVPFEVWQTLPSFLGRKSLPLRDGERPESVIEVFRGRVRAEVEQGGLNELVWDIRPALDHLIHHRLAALQEDAPELFDAEVPA